MTDFRSWESRLSSLYIRSKAPARPAHRLPWYKEFPHVECRRASATAKLSQPSVKPGGAVMCFDVAEGATAAMLTVSEFSAVVTFVSPGNTALAYWDLEGESVTYHRTETPAVPVQRSDEEHQCLLLKGEVVLHTWATVAWNFTWYKVDVCCRFWSVCRFVLRDPRGTFKQADGFWHRWYGRLAVPSERLGALFDPHTCSSSTLIYYFAIIAVAYCIKKNTTPRRR